MAIPATRSLLHPYAEEPLPLYTPRHPTATDPETSSIRSSAPSYTSAAPSYHSTVPPSHRRSNDFSSASSTNGNQNPGGSRLVSPSSPPQGMLSSERCAPGFGGYMRDSSRHNSFSGSGSSSSFSNLSTVHSLYNVSEWVPVTEGLQARHYHNVAKRRVTDTSSSAGTRPMLPLPAPTIPERQATCGMASSSRYLHGGSTGSNDVISAAPQRPSPSPVNGHGRGSQANINNYSSSTLSLGGDLENEPAARSGAANNNQEQTALDAFAESLPLSPHEDPDLVGEAAAARFRSQRLYMTAQQQQNLYVSVTANGTAPYSSLLSPETSTPTPTQSTDQVNRPGSSPNPPTQSAPRQSTGMHERHRSAATMAEDEALRAQEAKTWDFMLAQMADWEERERSWKKFKEEAEKKVDAGVFRGQGLRLGLGGKGKMKKTLSGDSNGGGGRSKWMSKVGFAIVRKDV